MVVFCVWPIKRHSDPNSLAEVRGSTSRNTYETKLVSALIKPNVSSEESMPTRIAHFLSTLSLQ